MTDDNASDRLKGSALSPISGIILAACIGLVIWVVVIAVWRSVQ